MYLTRRRRLRCSAMPCKVLVVIALSVSLGSGVTNSLSVAQPPGPELFAKEPRTPLELWDAIDYLLRTHQAQKAVSYIDKFVKSKPDDATLIAIRNRYGPGSILRLSDDPVTQPFAQPVADAMMAAALKVAKYPERLTQLIGELTKTSEAQDYAVRHLREAGPDAIPSFIQALLQPGLTPTDRRILIRSMGCLDHSVIPPLIAVLNSSDATLVADAATALGYIGNKEAVPFLTFPAAFFEAHPNIRAAARAGITQLTGQPFSNQPSKPVDVLIDAAWRYHRHQVDLGDGPITLWSWDDERKLLISRAVSRSEAEGSLGAQLAQHALRIDPTNADVRVVQLSLSLEKAIERVGVDGFLAKDPATFNATKAAGALILSDVLKHAIVDRKSELGAIVAMALGQVINRADLTATGRPHPLVEALYAPARRVQFAAAKALVELAPVYSFPGASQVVPTLARFVMNQAIPRAVVIDSNPTRGSQLAGFLIRLGYDSQLELNGASGFHTAAESADVALIMMSTEIFNSAWVLSDTLANLAADSRTRGIPIFLYGPLAVQYTHPNLKHNYPEIMLLVQPVSADILLQQLKSLPGVSTQVIYTNYAREAAKLLAQIATERKGPFFADLRRAESALALALNNGQTADNAATTLRDISDPAAQRSLADVILDPSKPPEIRKLSATNLVNSIQRFGPLVTATQEAKLLTSIREEANPQIRTSLLTVLHALTPALRSTAPNPLKSSVSPEEPSGTVSISSGRVN